MKEPTEIQELADRIDFDQQWRRLPLDRDKMTQAERDRCDAGVHLRRYASQRLSVLEELKKGAEYIRGFKLEREGCGTDRRGCGSGEWHHAINKVTEVRGYDDTRWMYTAKTLSDEVPRMIVLFEMERSGKLAKSFKLCGHDPRPAKPLPDNHLRCHLGMEARTCPYLLAIESHEQMTPEARDEAKAWTCAAHIMLQSNPDTFFEGFMSDKSDASFEERMMESWAQEHSRD